MNLPPKTAFSLGENAVLTCQKGSILQFWLFDEKNIPLYDVDNL